MHCYTVFKLTGTHADTLAAIGAAGALRHLGPRIVELEDRFEIRLPRRPTVSDLDAVGPGFAYLEREKKTQAMSEPAKLRRRGTASPAPSVACAFPTDDRRYAILARLKAYAGPNRVVLRYAGMPRDDWARALWRAFEGRREFVCSFPLVQLFNPHAACGYSLLKPRGTRRGDKTKNRWAEPFHEWLRFRGDSAAISTAAPVGSRPQICASSAPSPVISRMNNLPPSPALFGNSGSAELG